MMAFLGGGGFGGFGGACHGNDGGLGRAFPLHGGGNRGRNGRGSISGRRPIVVATAFFSVDRRGASSFTTSPPSSSSAAGASAGEVERKPIPIVLLAGFLGSGKTSTLKHLLENSDDVRIGTIVNDVAAVNIDAKLIMSGVVGKKNNGSNGNIDGGDDGGGDEDNNNGGDAYADGGVVELQNGCACCSLADELLESVVRLTDGGKRELDAIVVELSGVADPMSVRDNWEQARLVSWRG